MWRLLLLPVLFLSCVYANGYHGNMLLKNDYLTYKMSRRSVNTGSAHDPFAIQSPTRSRSRNQNEDTYREILEDSRTRWQASLRKRHTACADTSRTPHRTRESVRIRNRRDVGLQDVNTTWSEEDLEGWFGNAAYFSGVDESITLQGTSSSEFHLPQDEFTLEFWMQPEGGQHNPVSIIGLMDKCSPMARNLGWSVGIWSREAGEKDARVFFRLQGERMTSATTITAPSTYEEERWIHVAAVYNGNLMWLYLDGGRVGTGHGQRGPLVSATSSTCKELIVGGDHARGQYYRGTLDQIRIWDHARTQEEIINSMYSLVSESDIVDGLLFSEDFDDLDKWNSPTGVSPRLIESTIDMDHHDIELVPPPCGITVCDDPDVIRSYSRIDRMRSEKIIRYRVINVLEDDGSNPTVTDDQIKLQDNALKQAFRPYNISWKLEMMEVRNSSLRRRTILIACQPERVGNGYCNPECRHNRTGNDGGDCDEEQLPCELNKIGDGQCDFECNRYYHNWDGGDCCNPEMADVYVYCYDPTSPHRAFLSIAEYKERLGFASDMQLNIFFAVWTLDALIGLATFPWEKDVFSVLGGTVVRPDSFGHVGKTDSLVHEIGHNLGLWHVHHGISELDCNDICWETSPSLELGDLCRDTLPTPLNEQCADPIIEDATQSCGVTSFHNTPYDNYMSYARDSCTDHFTPEQAARMHCYLDLSYQPWQTTQLPSPVPVAPRVISSTASAVTMVWVVPIGSAATGIDLVCSQCYDDHSLVQYAETAFVQNQSSTSTFGAPLQAAGAPDAETCTSSEHAWMPLTGPGDDAPTYIELGFRYPAVPKKLSIWVTWNAADAIENVELIFKDDTVHSLGSMPGHCDKPITTQLDMEKLLTKVRIHVRQQYFAIDAVQLVSKQDHIQCRSCPALSYRVSREPAFPPSEEDGEPVEYIDTNTARFTDSSVSRGTSYQYSVEAVLGNKISAASPFLEYTHGQDYCGDGKLDLERGELCDDGNAINGDGCDLTCQQEELFVCIGEPSYCYHHDGDGICEDFEKLSSIRDCGFYTPEGFDDQWASLVEVSAEHAGPDCPAETITGSPSLDFTCRTGSVQHPDIWFPCRNSINNVQLPWIKAHFDDARVVSAVVIYLALGEMLVGLELRTVEVHLIDTENITHQIGDGNQPHRIDCHASPMVVNVWHDLSRAFYHARGVFLQFNSPHVGVAAVALRSNPHLNPIRLQECGGDQLYNPRTRQCASYTCQTPLCEEIHVENGEAECSGHGDGDTCTVSCNLGYEWSGSMGESHTIQCVDGAWTRDTDQLRCRPLDCRRPQLAHASIQCPEGTTFGKTCQFECQDPALKRGSDDSVTCEADGLWSLPNSFCQIVCPAPPAVPVTTLLDGSCDRQGEYLIGQSCRMRCQIGYHVVGRSNRKRRLRYVCGESGEWEGAGCEKIECPAPAPVFNGLYSCTDDFYVGSECLLKCPGSNRIESTIRCRLSGEWDSDFAPCKFEPGLCPDLENTSDLLLDCVNKTIGDTCEVYCMDWMNEVVLRPQSRRPHILVSEHQRPDYIPVSSLTCTGMLDWYPALTDMLCVEPCDDVYIGDGWCDPGNNREHCRWDGGDCCESTLGGIVQPIPQNCRQECACHDPMATENQITLNLAQALEQQRASYYGLNIDRSILSKSKVEESP